MFAKSKMHNVSKQEISFVDNVCKIQNAQCLQKDIRMHNVCKIKNAKCTMFAKREISYVG